MSLPLQILFMIFATVFILVGLLMMIAPSKFPRLYAGFLRQTVMQREKTEAGRFLATRVQGFIAAFTGLLFGLFVWAMR
jgi:hypothetical protein